MEPTNRLMSWTRSQSAAAMPASVTSIVSDILATRVSYCLELIPPGITISNSTESGIRLISVRVLSSLPLGARQVVHSRLIGHAAGGGRRELEPDLVQTIQ